MSDQSKTPLAQLMPILAAAMPAYVGTPSPAGSAPTSAAPSPAVTRQASLADVLPGLAAIMPAYTGKPGGAAASPSGPAKPPAPVSRSNSSLADVLPGLKAIMPAYVGGSAAAPASAASSVNTTTNGPLLGAAPVKNMTWKSPQTTTNMVEDPRMFASRCVASDEGPPITPRTLKICVLLPDPIDWNVEFQVFAPDVAGGIRKRLTALFRFVAATYFPEISFEFSEYIFEQPSTWPRGAELAKFDCVFVTGAKEGAYDHHVPYVPELERYIGENVNVTRWIGLSFGHQVIAWGLYPGGKAVIKNPTGWENAAVESVLTAAGQKALNTTRKTYRVHNHHGDTVLFTPPGCTQVSFTSQTPVQAFISDRVFTSEGHLEYSAGIMANWGCWDSTWGFYTLDTYRAYLADRVYTPACDNRLNYLPDALWLAGKMLGWLARDGKVPSDGELDARKARFETRARPVREAIERELVEVEYAEKVKEFGGWEKVKELKAKWKRYVEDGVPFPGL